MSSGDVNIKFLELVKKVKKLGYGEQLSKELLAVAGAIDEEQNKQYQIRHASRAAWERIQREWVEEEDR